MGGVVLNHKKLCRIFAPFTSNGLLKKMNMNPNAPRQQVIVSMTSFPAAIAYAERAVRSILAGSVLPDKVVLYLTFSQFGEDIFLYRKSILMSCDFLRKSSKVVRNIKECELALKECRKKWMLI